MRECIAAVHETADDCFAQVDTSCSEASGLLPRARGNELYPLTLGNNPGDPVGQLPRQTSHWPFGLHSVLRKFAI